MPSPPLYPMQPLGELSTSRRLLSYAERDIIGVEDPGVAAPPTDFSGWNECAAWTKRFGATHNVEHDTYGIHQTPKIASLFLAVAYDWQLQVPVIVDISYVQDKADTGRAPFVGATAVTLAAAGGGLYTVTLKAGYAFRSANLALVSYNGSDVPLDEAMKDFTEVSMARTYLDTTFAMSTTQFRVRRFAGTDPTTLAAQDGDFCIAVHSQ